MSIALYWVIGNALHWVIGNALALDNYTSLIATMPNVLYSLLYNTAFSLAMEDRLYEHHLNLTSFAFALLYLLFAYFTLHDITET